MQETVEDHSIASQIPCDASLMGTNEDRSAHDGNNGFLGQVNGKVKHLSQLVGLQETH